MEGPRRGFVYVCVGAAYVSVCGVQVRRERVVSAETVEKRSLCQVMETHSVIAVF